MTNLNLTHDSEKSTVFKNIGEAESNMISIAVSLYVLSLTKGKAERLTRSIMKTLLICLCVYLRNLRVSCVYIRCVVILSNTKVEDFTTA